MCVWLKNSSFDFSAFAFVSAKPNVLFVRWLFLRMAYNVSRLCEGGEIEAQMFKLALKPHFCKTAVGCLPFFYVKLFSK
jgi:hypothetical protein